MKLPHWLLIGTIIFMLLALYHQSTPVLTKDYVLPVRQTLYVDSSLNDQEEIVIISAALEWQVATHGLVQYTIVRLPTKQDVVPDRAILLISISQYFPEILSIDQQTGSTHLGYYYDHGFVPYIALVSERLDVSNYKTVVMHELGHALGLPHHTGIDGIGTLMYPYINLGADTITDEDLDQFCHLYGCNGKDLHRQ